MKRSIFTLLIVVTLLAAAGCDTLTNTSDNSALEASGIIEATEVSVASEMSGRVMAVGAAEGEDVLAGDVLVRLDASLYRFQRQAMTAALDMANKGVLTAQAAVDAAVDQYWMTLDAALTAEQQARVANWTQAAPEGVELPNWYYARYELARAAGTAVDEAGDDLEEAQADLTTVLRESEREPFLQAEAQLVSAQTTFAIAAALLDKAAADPTHPELEDAAQKVYDEARDQLEDAQDAYNDALTTKTAQDVLAARARVAVAQERYDMARDLQRSLQTGDKSPQVIAAANAVSQARAALAQAEAAAAQVQAELDLLDAQIARLEVTAPLDGVVLNRVIEPGEIAQAGMTLMTIADLDHLSVMVYIPENRYGEVRLGDQASLSVDSFPGRTFSAKVTRIADQAEFTPRNVQTKEERQTTVFAVELSVENPDGALKPGMPADVVFP